MQFIKTKFLFILTLIPLFVLSQECSKLEAISWILGMWQQEDEKNLTTETWTKLSSNTFDGTAQTLSKKQNKVTFVEELRIVELSNEVFYIVKVSHNAFPVSFKLTECSDSTAVFENSGHDFPKKIIYRMFENGQRLNVYVSNEERDFTVEFNKIMDHSHLPGRDGDDNID